MILGVSPDDVGAQARFRRKYDLPFTLLADPDHRVAEQYGVWREKTLYGRKYMGVVRTTFIIAPDGTLAHVFENVQAAGHAAEVAAFLAASDGSGA